MGEQQVEPTLSEQIERINQAWQAVCNWLVNSKFVIQSLRSITDLLEAIAQSDQFKQWSTEEGSTMDTRDTRLVNALAIEDIEEAVAALERIADDWDVEYEHYTPLLEEQVYYLATVLAKHLRANRRNPGQPLASYDPIDNVDK